MRNILNDENWIGKFCMGNSRILTIYSTNVSMDIDDLYIEIKSHTIIKEKDIL